MKKKAFAFLAALVLALTLPVTVLANSAEPPRLSVIVLNPPKDLELSLVFTLGDEAEPVEAEAQQLAWEGYYLFRPASFPDFWDWDSSPEDMTVELLASTGGNCLSIPIDNSTLAEGTGAYYNNLCVLDLSAGTLTPGAPWWRQPLLVALRVALTLVLEGLVFLLFGYRQRRSWLVFLLVNLVTQFAVNLMILTNGAPMYSSGGRGLLFWLLYTPMELLVLLAEMLAFAKLLQERTKGRAVLYAAAANLVSWGVGGAALTYLPL